MRHWPTAWCELAVTVDYRFATSPRASQQNLSCLHCRAAASREHGSSAPPDSAATRHPTTVQQREAAVQKRESPPIGISKRPDATRVAWAVHCTSVSRSRCTAKLLFTQKQTFVLVSAALLDLELDLARLHALPECGHGQTRRAKERARLREDAKVGRKQLTEARRRV